MLISNARKVVFLDIDGVLNTHHLRCKHGIDHINNDKIKILKKIIEATGAEIVLSSTWRIRDRDRDRELVLCSLAEEDLGFLSWTVNCPHGVRADEIRSWLHDSAYRHGADDGNPVAKFAIIDDWDEAGVGFEDSFFQTVDNYGLTGEIADAAIAYLNG